MYNEAPVRVSFGLTTNLFPRDQSHAGRLDGAWAGNNEERVMKRIAMFVAPLVAIALALTYSQALRAADAPAAATGTVSVTVTDKDGKAVEGATVRITEHKAGGAKAGADAKLADDNKGGAAGSKMAPIAEGKTDKDGKAKLENIAAGEYNLSANLKGQGNAREKITVKAGETLDVALKLAPKAAK